MEKLRIRSAVNANLQNSINTSIILHYVRKLGTTYRTKISKALNLSLPAVSRAVDHLIEMGLLKEQKIITPAGKQAHEVEINAGLGMSVGISFELPMMKIARMDMAGTVIDIQEIHLDTETGNLEQTVLELIEHFFTRKQFVDRQDIPAVAITISVPAAIDLTHEHVHAVLYQEMGGLKLKQKLEQTFSIPIFLENNENLAALAEKYYREGIPENNFAYITIHHGIGAGLFLNGQIYRGMNGAAGEIGYQHMGLNPFLGAASMETFETIASIHQIQQIALNFIHKGKGEEIFKAANYSYNQITHELIGKMAQQGSIDAGRILERYAEVLAIGISNLLVTVNPEIIIFGGQLNEIPDCESCILDPLRRHLQNLVPFPVPDIRMTRLGSDAAVIGACQMGLEQSILSQYPYSI